MTIGTLSPNEKDLYKIVSLVRALTEGRSNLTSAQATALLDVFAGDSGSGGVKGLVPAPAPGDAAASKYLKASGLWVHPQASNLSDYIEGAWTPAISFVTPGDLSVAYLIQAGSYTKIGRLVAAHFALVTSTFSYTTAVGNCVITGLPFTVNNEANLFPVGAMLGTGWTSTATQIVALAEINTTRAQIIGSGSGIGNVTFGPTQMPSGSSKGLRGTIIYQAAP